MATLKVSGLPYLKPVGPVMGRSERGTQFGGCAALVNGLCMVVVSGWRRYCQIRSLLSLMVENAILLSLKEQIMCCIQPKQELRTESIIVDWLTLRIIVFITRKGSEQRFH